MSKPEQLSPSTGADASTASDPASAAGGSAADIGAGNRGGAENGSSPALDSRSSSGRMMGRAIAESESTGGALVIGVNTPPSSFNPLLAGDQLVDSVLQTIFYFNTETWGLE